jgi:hypothetical protein
MGLLWTPSEEPPRRRLARHFFKIWDSDDDRRDAQPRELVGFRQAVRREVNHEAFFYCLCDRLAFSSAMQGLVGVGVPALSPVGFRKFEELLGVETVAFSNEISCLVVPPEDAARKRTNGSDKL